MPRIEISIARQQLTVFDDGGRALRRYDVSSSKNGAGEQKGSY